MRRQFFSILAAAMVSVTLSQVFSARPAYAETSAAGQVYKSGHLLYDGGGRWPVNGVQFFLPDYGINTWTFHDGNYTHNLQAIDYWLGKASDYLLAKTLRIFVELPNNGVAPTSYSTVHDFAVRADSRGMRLGLVLHNSADFAMTAERRNWIDGLITYFNDRGATPMIAYVSADNEINNHCSGRDCFDNDQSYINRAIDWTAAFNDIFKRRQSPILVTAGIATEVTNIAPDTEPATKDFFKPHSANSLTLAKVTDFLSPHNYGGGGYGIIDEMRRFGYAGPVVLEEFGFPTDPVTKHPYYTEGPASCRSNPWPGNADCVNTAPYFVEINARAIRDTRDSAGGYAGGVAWMIADINRKSCSSAHDLYTGLFAAGSGYDCGGTRSTAPGQDKATAFRVRTHHYYYRGGGAPCGRLDPGQALARGQSVKSCNGAVTLVHQVDGNVVAYDARGALWSTGTAGRTTTYFVMQTDGNLVLYDGSTPLWASGTANNPGAVLAVQDDCNLVIYHNGAVRWASYKFCRA